ncbi:cysteine desulfurase [Patescibacteria group bacterium]|nr:cysteine desulfurase [Patescibacteria group bacterium]
MAKFINADREEIIFTKNTTESINLVAKTWKKPGKIMVSVMEHHSNFLPWQELSAKCKVKSEKLVVLDINDKGELDLTHLDKMLKGVSLVAITHVSNVLGTINPVEEIVKKAHQAGALVLIDGAQAVGHFKVDIKKLGCDFYVFSGHKCLGPSGVGVLWMRKEIAQSLPPFLTGGGMVSKVTLESADFLDVPQKFEAGTPNIEGVIGLGAAIDYLNSLGIEKIRQHEQTLTKYALKKLSKIKALTIYGPQKRAGIIAFNIKGIHPHDLASFLDQKGIAVRAGLHCAMPLHQRLGIKASARISFHIYNSLEEIDKLVESLGRLWI